MSKPIDIFYLCDKHICESCSAPLDLCKHTDNIEHAFHKDDLDERLFKYVYRGDRIGFFEVEE